MCCAYLITCPHHNQRCRGDVNVQLKGTALLNLMIPLSPDVMHGRWCGACVVLIELLSCTVGLCSLLKCVCHLNTVPLCLTCAFAVLALSFAGVALSSYFLYHACTLSYVLWCLRVFVRVSNSCS